MLEEDWIKVVRHTSNSNETVSSVYFNGELVCHGLEDQQQNFKVMGETRISAGKYRIGIRDVGGFHNRYSKRFKFHKGMLQILDVPEFEYVLIHVGNDDDDTGGCLLVGAGSVVANDGTVTISNSVLAYTRLYNKVIESAIVGTLAIEYIDADVY